MAKKTVKKVDVKKVEKAKVMEIVAKALLEAGYEVSEGDLFGFTSGTVVVKGAKCDVQLKPITPKAGVDRYEQLEEEDEEEDEVVQEEKAEAQQETVEEEVQEEKIEDEAPVEQEDEEAQQEDSQEEA